jgi:hypothetical protein
MELLFIIIGLLVGFYARVMFDYVKSIYVMLVEKHSSHKAGVVRPQVSQVTRNQPINLESQTGGVLRPSPNQVLLDAAAERDRRLKNS